MAKCGKMQGVMMRVLAVMMVASFLLAVAGFVSPTPVAAGCYTTYETHSYGPCGSCYLELWEEPGKNVDYWWCEEDPCAGWGPYCQKIWSACAFC